MNPTILFSNGKGGVGKTTFTGLVALALARKLRRVGIRDTDTQGTLTSLAQLPAYKLEGNIRVVPPGPNDMQVTLVDSPPRLDDPAFIAAFNEAALVVLVTTPQVEDLWTTAKTFHYFRKVAPNKPVCLALNELEPGRVLTRDLDDSLAKEGLAEAPRLKHALERRTQYGRALRGGWRELDDEGAQRDLIRVASEVYELAVELSRV